MREVGLAETIDNEVGSIRKKAYRVIAALAIFRQLFHVNETSLLIFCAAPQRALDYNPNSRNAQTIITEWHLYGTKEWIPGFLQSIYYVGVLIGATVFGQLSDIYGRKIVAVTGYSFLLINAACMALAQNWQQLAMLRLSLGFFSCHYVADTVLLQELCGRSLWAFNGIVLGTTSFVLHTLLYILTAYFFPDWRTLCLVDTAIALLVFIHYYYIPESPRWLYSKGRVKEARNVIAKFQRWNRKKRGGTAGSHGYHELLVEQEDHHALEPDGEISTDTERVNQSFHQRANILDLLRNSSLRTRSLILGLQWITSSFIYYSLTFGAGSFSQNFYLAHTISTLSPLPGMPLLLFLMERKRCGRRRTLAICNFVTALSAFVSYIIPSDSTSSVKLILMVIGKLGISLSYDLIYVYTPELFPTAVRNVGLGAMSTSARIGGIIAPFLAYVMVSDTQTPFLLYGVMCTACGFLGLFLPETVAKKIPETMDDIYKQDESS